MSQLEPIRERAASRDRRLPRPPLIFGAMLAATLLFRCSDKSGGATASGSCPPGVCGGAGLGVGGQPQSGGSEAQLTIDWDGITLPVLSCADATVNGNCPLPRSRCTPAGKMVYLSNPTCDHGTCRWSRTEMSCPYGSCYGGGCEVPSTPGPIPPNFSGGAGNGGTPKGSGGTLGSAGAGGTINSSGAGGALGSGGAGGMTEPPTYLCADAGVTEDCPTPPTACADASTLATYDHPSCSFGTCSWLRHTVPCQDTCVAGHCAAGHANDDACFTGGACVLPPSQCLDGTKMLYFSNPRCADEGSGMRCVTEGRVVDCGARGCMNGGCLPRSTLAL
jgi:hypothetical protein